MTFREYVESKKEIIISKIRENKEKRLEESGVNYSTNDLDTSGVWVWYNKESNNTLAEKYPDVMSIWCCETEPHWEDNLADFGWKGVFMVPPAPINKTDSDYPIIGAVDIILLNREDISDLNDLENLRVFLRA